jgi:hypothetical protein
MRVHRVTSGNSRFTVLSSLTLIVGFYAFLAPSSRAQDTHYWNLQYGSHSLLLGGAVIGSVTDLGATYYNPGSLALFDAPEIALTGQSIQFERYRLESGIGEGIDLTSSRSGANASLAATSFDFKRLKGHRFAYSTLPRQRMSFSMGTIQTGVTTEYTAFPGETRWAAELGVSQSFEEQWHGLSWSMRLSDNVGIGVTNFLALRSQSITGDVLVEVLAEDGRVAVALADERWSFNHTRILWKIGFRLNQPRYTAGLTVTTPSIGVSGGGSVLVNKVETGAGNDLLVANMQDDVPSTYKSPLSIGLGGSFRWRTVRIHVSAEWFDRVPRFTALNPVDFVGQTTGDTLSRDLTHSLSAVLNYGVGIDFRIGDRVTGFGSFVTDHSGADDQEATNLSRSFWDIYHAAGGAIARIGPAEFTLGAAYAFANEKVDTNISIDDPDDSGLIGPGEENADLLYRRLTLILGFSVSL